jgi:hypothetical protein
VQELNTILGPHGRALERWIRTACRRRSASALGDSDAHRRGPPIPLERSLELCAESPRGIAAVPRLSSHETTEEREQRPPPRSCATSTAWPQ